MPYKSPHYFLAAAGHHLEPLARGQRKKVIELELTFPLGIVLGQLQNHS
jgi:hypothetical protein